MPIQRSISSTGETLRNIILSVTPHLRNISPEASAVKPHPDKWSKKEIIGHMIDSASNNHQRFVRSQFQEDMVFAGYQQNDWVHVQAYQSRSWSELIELWAAYNLQLAHIISHTLDEIRFRPVSRHNLHQITFKRIPESENTCWNILW